MGSMNPACSTVTEIAQHKKSHQKWHLNPRFFLFTARRYAKRSICRKDREKIVKIGPVDTEIALLNSKKINKEKKKLTQANF